MKNDGFAKLCKQWPEMKVEESFMTTVENDVCVSLIAVA